VRSPARPDVAEAIGVTDDVTVDVRSPTRPDVAEAIGVADDVTVDVRSPARPDIAEAIGVADDVTVDVRSPARPDVAEAIGVADEVTVTVEPASAGSFAYIALQGADSVAVVDRATNTLLPKIPVGSFPFAVAVRPGGSEVYVTNRGDGSVSVIDIATQSVVATIANVANDPIDLAFGPDGSTAYVVDNDASLVGVIDATTRTVTTPLQGSTRLSRAIAVTASGATAYVAGVDSLVVFDLLAGAAADTIAGTFTTGDIALTPDDAELWLTDGANDDVLVFDAVAGALAATVTAIPPSPQGIRIDQAGATAYVAHAASGLTPINIAARTPDAAIDLSFDPEWLAVSGDGALAYVSEGRQGSLLAVVNLASRSIIATLTVGPSPAKIGLTP
jgi:YVTN family beta-propeller protein